MAAFDIQQQRMCVRIVFDGVGSAGKTTNLRQLAEIFATQRSCELFSSAEMDGRTLYFDWLQIAAGMVCGFPLVCQVITVPGQLVLTPRRRYLLSTADVVVHVCDSDEHAVARALDGLTLFDELERERGESVPLVVQANKQDQRGALSGTALLATMGRTGVPVVEAIATDGIGVVDTFVAAVRAVVKSIQARVERGVVHVPVRCAETAASVLDRLSVEDIDPEWAVEMLLEEASNEFTFSDSFEAESDAIAGDRANEAATWRPSSFAGHTPALPTEDVPTGFIWPAHTGRAALRALANEPGMSKPVAPDEHGVARIILDDFVLSTGLDLRFENPESARQALVRSARERTQLASLLAPETVLVVQPAGNGASWLWTVLPRMATVAQLVGSREQDALARTDVLAAFGSALADALKVELAHGVALDFSAESFGVHQGVIRYLGTVVHAPPPEHDAAKAVLESLGALAAFAGDLEPLIAALESAVGTKLSSDELTKLARSTVWRDSESVPATLIDVRARLEGAFKQGQKAA